MDMPEKVLLQMNRGWRSVEEVVCGGTEYIKADAGNVLPDFPLQVKSTCEYTNFSKEYGDWYCRIFNKRNKRFFTGQGGSLRAAAEDAIAKIGDVK